MAEVTEMTEEERLAEFETLCVEYKLQKDALVKASLALLESGVPFPTVLRLMAQHGAVDHAPKGMA
jgi:hypothetical protein